ncbi:hypothetical protein N0V93_001450 [Gnomoniopsis smithogilvyi]|uniref:GRF-type domain-containing protein n=1 Tax=Gnomoniopsis smithogilvyi TaxID=1191159 RepID=A0A9W8Z1N5_9PEZI|nr:hypothetical protein N0V93_001450 [Gnomoniopsis smithogilvyi]
MGFKTPSKRGGSARNKAQPFTPRKKGLFEDGQWLCDCRKPALFLLVKKDGPNKGKHFYTCDTKKCSFFLWESDAKPREREALMTHNCRSENGIVGRIQAKGEPPATPSFPRSSKAISSKTAPPRHQQQMFTGMNQADNRDIGAGSVSQDGGFLDYSADEDDTQQAQVGSGTSSHTMRNDSPGSKVSIPAYGRMSDPTSHNHMTTPSAKRKRSGFLLDSDEEFGDNDLDDSDMERELAAATDESVRKVLFKTPAAERTAVSNGLPTPATRTNRNSLSTAAEDTDRNNKRQRFAESGRHPEAEEPQSQSQSQSLPAGQGHALYIGEVGTPTPYRKTDAFTQPDAPTTPTTSRLLNASTPTVPTPTDYPRITVEVMALLVGQPEATRRNVQQVLELHELRVRGVAMGRDAARAALGARDSRIAELQSRVVALENSRRMDRGRLRQLSEGLLSLTQEEGE